MSPVQPNHFEKLITLKQASELLGVPIETLLSWNQHNILKPTITADGEIGYTQHQINQFLTIRQLTHRHETTQQPTHAPLPQPQQPYVPALHVSSVNELPKTPGAKSHSSRVLLYFASIVILFGVAVLLQLVTPVPDQNRQTNVLGSQTSKLNISKQANATLPIQLQNDGAKNLNNEGDNITKEKIVAPSLYEVVKPKSIASQTPSLSGKHHPTDIASDGATNTDLASVAYFDTCTNCTDDKDSAIDASGNIKGNVDKPDTLAAAVGRIDSMVKSDVAKPTDTTNQLIFLSLGFLAVLYLFQKQFAFPTKKSQTTHVEPYKNPGVLLSQKVLEVGQKTDGTVVLIIRGKEYKISKPEMNSESDQFIERLMTLTQTGIKEIEYDTLKADKVYLMTPLSRLVTRLGFVGIKRDLFFPRTSKNSVLFRKYVTQQDLDAMNLTTDHILNELELLS